MTLLQRLIKSLLPRRLSASIRAESESWLLKCSRCGTVRSVWEAGGARFEAASVGKANTVWCNHCGRLRLMTMERKPSA